MATIDLKGLNKAAVLAVLYNASKPQGAGFMRYDSTPMTAEQAEKILKQTTDFDYLMGRVMKINLDGDTVDPTWYDRDNGQGAAAAAIASLQNTNDVNCEAIAKTHSDATFLSASEMESHLGAVGGFVTDPSEPVAVFQLGTDHLPPELADKVKKAKEANKDK